MSTVLNNSPAEQLFSSQLEDLVWTTDSDRLSVRVARTGPQADEFYRSSLKSDNGKITLWELRELVEEYMRNNDLACMTMQVVWIEVVSGIGYTNGVSFMVIYNALDSLELASWVHGHFLTTLEHKTLPNRGEAETLAFINLEYRDSTPEYMVSVAFDDGSSPTVVELKPEQRIYEEKGLCLVNVNIEEIYARTAALVSGDFSIMQLLVKVADRYMIYSRPRPGDEPGVVLAFLNAFNVVEWCRIHGTTTVKTANNAKMASVSRRLVKYDHNLDVTYEVQTAPLMHDMARWLAQMTTSPKVWLKDGTQVVIESDTHEFCDDPLKMNEAKFSWKRTDKRDKMRNDLTAGGIFNIVYNDIYA